MLKSSRTQFLNLSTILVITTVSLLSCNNQTHTVEYYLEHLEEMRAKVKECESGRKADIDQNCKNAFEAMLKIGLESKEMPKIK